MPRRNGLWGEQWAFCDRCGMEYPISWLSKQKGLLVCKARGCYDNLENEKRQYLIADILADGKEAEDPKSEKKAEPDPWPDLMF